MVKELRSRTAERQEKENSESGHLYPLKVVNEVPSLIEEHFGCSNINVSVGNWLRMTMIIGTISSIRKNMENVQPITVKMGYSMT